MQGVLVLFDEVSANANLCIIKLNTWFSANKLSLSLDKICFSVFGVRDDNARCKVELRLDNVILKQVSCCKSVSYTHLTLPTKRIV